MRFLVDASSDARLVPHLRSLGHDVTRVGSDYPPDLPDTDILAIAHQESRILVTDDRDFGELVYRLRQPHAGVIYLRLGTTRIAVRYERLDYVLVYHSDQFDRFLTVTEQSVRVR